MIRVNLLPQKRGARGAAPAQSQRWLLVVLGVLVFEIVGLFFLHRKKLDELEVAKANNQKIGNEINDIKKFIAPHEEVKKALAQLRAREDAIAKLELARSGPTAVLLELATLLTRDRGPTSDPEILAQVRSQNPLAGFNPGWDTHRLWLTSYVESSRVVRIEGLARDGADVSEFAQRLKLSVYFYDVKLLPGKKEPVTKDRLELVNFALELKVRY